MPQRDSGILMFFKPHSRNAEKPIFETDLGIHNPVKDWQLQNASSPIYLILGGNVTLSRDIQSSNAESGIAKSD